MRRASVIQVLKWTGLTILGTAAIVAASAVLPGRAVAAEPAAGSAAAPAQPGKKESGATRADASPEKKSSGKKAKGEKGAKPRGRLPAYFGGVVNEEQREKIYSIQKEYEPKISQLRQQLDSLTKARDEKINSLLTPDQKKMIEDAKAAAKQSREKKDLPETKKKKTEQTKKRAEETVK